MEEEIEQKQNYLRTEIIDRGYDPDMFTKYIISTKGEDGFDLDNWSMNELIDIVRNFKNDYEEAKRQGVIKEDTAVAQEEEKTHNQPKENNHKTKESKQSTKSSKQTFKMQDMMASQSQQLQQSQQSQQQETQQKQPQSPSKSQQQAVKPNNPTALKQFFPQSPKSQSQPSSQFQSQSQTVNQKEVDGFVKVDKSENSNEDTKAISSLEKFYPFQNYTELVSCNKIEKSPLTNLSKVKIEVSNPEMIKSGLFSFSFLQFTLTTKELNFIAVRKISDFEWFYYKINEQFPGIAIPYFPLKKFFEKSNELEIQKKMMYTQKFINALVKIKVIRSSKLFYDFISLSKEQWKSNNIMLSKKQTPMSLQQFSNLEGMIEVNITKEMDDNAQMIQKQFALRSGLHKRLTNAYNNIMAQMTIMSDALLELANTYKDLSQTYNESIFKNDSIYTAYTKIGNLFNDWSTGYQKQIDFFKYELKYFFKYIHKEIDCFTSVIEEYKNSRSKYLDMNVKFSKIPFISNNQQLELSALKHYYGYFMKQALNESKRLDHNHAKRLKRHFETVTERKPEFIVDYMSFMQLVNFYF